MPPGDRDLRWAHFETPLGPMLAAATDRGLAALTLGTDLAAFLATLHHRFPRAGPRPDSMPDVIRWIAAFADGRPTDPPVVDLRGLPEFDAAVYMAVRSIPFGAIATYGDMAAAIGAPRAARAVGGAMSRCPLFPAVPCHRVVLAADGWSGWGSGDLSLKRRLLALESGVPAADMRRTTSSSTRTPLRRPTHRATTDGCG